MLIKKLKQKLAKWVIKDIPIMQPTIQPIIITPESLKKFHAQHIVDWFEWHNSPLTPDCFVNGFKYDVINKLLDEIIVKAEETPDGIVYSCDLLFRNL